jgi:eukaryotic-like serine/threonine-protein kinase
MIAVTQPVGAKPPPTAADNIRDWLDQLASGDCDQGLFVQSMQQRFQFEPDGNWEVLSQLDQYYRRGKIRSDVFLAVKTALAGHALGAGNNLTAHVTAPTVASTPRSKANETQPQVAVRELKLGDTLRDRYRIASILGQGGMGTVFEAIDEFRLEVPPSGQRLAIKVLHSAVTSRTELLTELRREFQHLQMLSHPNIVRVFEFDRDGPLAFFTMELLNGMLLSRLLQVRKRVPLERSLALAFIRDIGAAVAHAHSRGVVHGDINPQNIFVSTTGELRVLDFGASHKVAVGLAAPDDRPALGGFATPGYASCQVLEGARPDARDDVFALACVAYLLLCAKHPFPGCTAVQARAAGLSARRPEHLSHQQWRVLREGLRWERESRPADVEKWLQQLDLRLAARSATPLTGLLQDSPPRQRKVGRSLAVLGAVVLLLAGAYWMARRDGAMPWPLLSAPAETAEHPPPSALQPPAIQVPAPAPAPAREAPASHADSQPVHVAETAPTPRPAAPPPTPLSSPAPALPPARIEMAADTIDVAADEPAARVLVRRKGNLKGEVGFTWWTESGTAKPGTDFVAVVPRVEHIESGKNSVSLSIPLIHALRPQSRSFYVVIDQPEGDAKLGARALTMVTLVN